MTKDRKPTEEEKKIMKDFLDLAIFSRGYSKYWTDYMQWILTRGLSHMILTPTTIKELKEILKNEK